MHLKTITLHPFGRFADETWSLDRPLVVIHGPNELGKTTLRQAIMHALFTPTNQTPTQFRNAVERWVPQPGGDHASVTLTFEHGGSEWTLVKRWGAGASSRLTDGTTVLADAANVQKKMAELLAHNEATFRHVFFTGQAELERTLDAIEEHSGHLRDIRDLLCVGAGAAGGVDEQRLRRSLDEKIAKAFGRWDDERGRPERQNGQERGVANPWRRETGRILEAWYAWQRIVAERDEVLELERTIDHVNREVAGQEQVVADASAFVSRHGHLRNDLNERGLLEERLVRLDRDVLTLAEAYRGWPVAMAAVDVWTTRTSELETIRTDLQSELESAEKCRDGQATRDAFHRVEVAKRAWEEAVAAAEKIPALAKDQVTEVDRLSDAITTVENKLAARKLAWRIEAEEPGDVRIERGIEPAETLTIVPAGTTGTAEARVRVVAGGITLTVESGDDDVDELFRALGNHRSRLAEALAALEVPSREALVVMTEKRRDADAVVKEKKAAFTGALGSKTLEQWEEEIKALDDLPSTRGIDVVKALLETVRTQLVTEATEAKKQQDSLDAWTKAYVDPDALGEKLIAAKADLSRQKKRLETLATLPEGFDSAQVLIAKLDEAQRSKDEAQRQLMDLKTRCAELTTTLGDRRSQDIAEAAEVAQRKFERVRVEGRDYRRIKHELDRIAADAATDPLGPFGDKVAALFSRITGTDASLEFEGQLPTQVVRGSVSLSPERLSHGGGGALALAVRLAMAEAYLANGGGFLMFDDPLVHFDQSRMAVAAAIIREASVNSQVIFFTCHQHHAEQLSAS